MSVQNLFSGKRGTAKMETQELMGQAMNSIEIVDRSAASSPASYEVMKDKVQELTIRLMQEKDLQNVSVRQRLMQVDLQKLLKLYFHENKIGVPFSYEVLTKKDVLEKVKNKEVYDFYYVPLFPNDTTKTNNKPKIQKPEANNSQPIFSTITDCTDSKLTPK
mgnify:CR=1 FL=1